jgi:hypothetical protein
MANLAYRLTDTAGTEVFATAAFPTTDTPTDWIEVAGWRFIDFFIVRSSGSGITDFTATVECEFQAGSPPTGYPLTLEQVNAGPPVTADQSPYIYSYTGAFPPTGTGQIVLSVPVRGRYMRLVFSGGPGPVGGSENATIFAVRRTS